MTIAAVINFSSNDYPFLKNCIEGVEPFVNEIIIPVCDHSSLEDKLLLNRIYLEHPECRFLQFAYDEKNYYSGTGSYAWNNLSRLIGHFYASAEVDYLLFLDADEIVEADKFMQWLGHFPYVDYAAMRLACYWYFRKPIYRAKNWEDTPLFVKRSALNGDLLMHPAEREGLFKEILGKKKRAITGLDGQPMIHHYRWVRNGAHPFSGNELTMNNEFQTVVPYVDIDLGKKPSLTFKDKPKNVRYLSIEEIHKIDLSICM